MSVNKYSTSPAGNTSVGDGSGAVGIQEGMPRGNVNDAIRAMAADLAKFYKDQGSLVTVGTGSAYTVSATSDFTGYAQGMALVVKFHADCLANATINVNALGNKLLKMRKDAGLANVEAGAIRAGEIHHIVYDGTAFTAVGLIDYPKIKSDIAALFALFDGDALAFNSIAASGAISAGGGGVTLSGTSVNASFGNFSSNVEVGGQTRTKYLLMDAAGGYYTLVNDGTLGGTVTVTGSLIKSGQSYWHPTNDGAGSGLDADLLDGQQGSYYTAITARLGYTPVQNGTGVGQAGNAVKIGWDAGSGIKATVDSTDFNYLARAFNSSSVMGEIGAAGTGGVGTVAMLRLTSGASVGPGGLVAGSALRYSNADGTDTGIAPAGTWRCMGAVGGGYAAVQTSIFVRVV